MAKSKCFLVIDTETCGDINDPLVYDIGAQVINLSGTVLESGSWTVYDIYAKQRKLMKTAYYAEKLPQYEKGMKQGEWTMCRLYTIRKILWEWMKKYNVIAVCAYNAKFDRKALNNTLRFITNDKGKFFFPYNTEFIDIWNMACSTIFQSAKYRKSAYENEWFSDKGNVRTTAEMAYRYLANTPDFEESHTALDDVKIETQIFLHCWDRCSDEDMKIVGNPWRKPQKFWYYAEAKKDGRL